MKTMILFLMPDRTLRSAGLDELPTYPFDGMKLLASDGTVYRVSDVVATVGVKPSDQMQKLLRTVMTASEVASRGNTITPFAGGGGAGGIVLPGLVTDVPRVVLVTLESISVPDIGFLADGGDEGDEHGDGVTGHPV